MKKSIRTIFILMLLLALLAGFGRTIFQPIDINVYENRYAQKVLALTGRSFADGSFQDSLDSALADQVQGSEDLKRSYNSMRSSFMRAFLPLLTGSAKGNAKLANPKGYDYVALDDTITRLFGPEHLCILPKPLDDELKEQIDEHSANTNAVIARNPGVEFYAYYIEKDIDLDLRTGEKCSGAEYVFDSLDIPAGNTAKFVISNAASFDYYFFMTDHHWNYLGSNLAYQQLHALLGMEGPLLKASSEEADLAVAGAAASSGTSGSSAASSGASGLSAASSGTATVTKDGSGFNVYNLGQFGGSRSTGTYSSFKETFYAYKYSFPNFVVTQNGEPTQNYGNQEKYIEEALMAAASGNTSGAASKASNGAASGASGKAAIGAASTNASGTENEISYPKFYGYDCGEATIFRNEGGSNKLLVIGDSYDNALLKLLANHYDELYSIDLRYYKEYFGEAFDFDSYVAKHGITKVLFIGNRELFTTDQFLLDGKEAN